MGRLFFCILRVVGSTRAPLVYVAVRSVEVSVKIHSTAHNGRRQAEIEHPDDIAEPTTLPGKTYNEKHLSPSFVRLRNS